MGLLGDEVARQSAERERSLSLPPFGGGFQPFVPTSRGMSVDFAGLAQEFCAHLRPDDGDVAAQIRYGDQDFLYRFPPKLARYEAAIDFHGKEHLHQNRERIDWIKSNDLGGGRLLTVYDYEGSMEFGRVNGAWSPVANSSFPIWGSYGAASVLAKWLLEHGRG